MASTTMEINKRFWISLKILGEVVPQAEIQFVEKGEQEDLHKMVASTNVMEIFLVVAHVLPKEVVHADRALEESGKEDRAGEVVSHIPCLGSGYLTNK